MPIAEEDQLDDLSSMPFGKWRGVPMQDIDASYFHWLFQNGLRHKPNDPVADYIWRNMEALKKEYPDGIWS